MAVAEYDLDNLLNPAFQTKILNMLGMKTKEELSIFLLEAIAAPINVVGLNKEIFRKLWVFQGLALSTYPNTYIKSKVGFLNQDIVFVQAAILLIDFDYDDGVGMGSAGKNITSSNSNSKNKKVTGKEIEEE